MYFNIEINILDLYSFECEKVHVLVFISYWINVGNYILNLMPYKDVDFYILNKP